MNKAIGCAIVVALVGSSAQSRAESGAKMLLRYFDNSLIVQSALSSESAELRQSVLNLRRILRRINSIGPRNNQSLTPFSGVHLFECAGMVGQKPCTLQISDTLVSLTLSPNAVQERGLSLNFAGTAWRDAIKVKSLSISSYRGRHLRPDRRVGGVKNFRVDVEAPAPSLRRGK